MKLTKKRIYLIAGVICVLVVIASLPKKGMGRQPVEEEKVVSVTAGTVQKTDVQEYLKMNGSVQADNTISVYPDMSGKIVKTYVSLGSNVKRGSVIADIDPSTPGTVYVKSQVIAPISGTITSLPLTIGTQVNTTTEIAKIGEIRRLQIKANVAENDIAPVKTGLTATVSLGAYPDEVFTATVSKVSPVVDETSRTKEIYYVFDQNDPRINAGMYVRIKLNTTLHKDVIAVSVDSITTIDDKQYVYVIQEDDTVKSCLIKTGVQVDDTVIVTEGLSEGQKIVTSGLQALSDGTKVRVVEK